jgi:hypothetical protein
VINLGSISVGNATLVVANVLTCNNHSHTCGLFSGGYNGGLQPLQKATNNMQTIPQSPCHSQQCFRLFRQHLLCVNVLVVVHLWA